MNIEERKLEGRNKVLIVNKEEVDKDLHNNINFLIKERLLGTDFYNKPNIRFELVGENNIINGVDTFHQVFNRKSLIGLITITIRKEEYIIQYIEI